MTNIIPLDTGRAASVLRGRASSLNQAGRQGVAESFAVVSLKGKSWSLRYQGETTVITDGQGLPRQLLEVVIVGISPAISKEYYSGNYSGEEGRAPDCWSLDGVAPDRAVPNKQARLCADCPRNVWGSKVSEISGKATRECADKRRIAIVPVGDLTNEKYGGPMMLRLPATSLRNLKKYVDMLEQKGAPIEGVATGLSFEAGAAFPRVEFRPLGWLNDAQALEIVGPDGNGGMCAHPVLKRMLGVTVEQEQTMPQEADAEEDDPLGSGGPAATFAGRHAQAPEIEAAETFATPIEAPIDVKKAAKPNGGNGSRLVQAPADMAATIEQLLNAPLSAD